VSNTARDLLSAPPALSDQEFAHFQRFIFDAAGITLADSKKMLVTSRLAGRVQHHGFSSFAQYFREAGFEVLDMQGMDIDFEKVQTLSGTEVYRFIKKMFLANRSAEGIYILGPAWRTLDIIEPLEQDLGVPVVHHLPAQAWEIQKRLHVNQPKQGLGRLLREIP